jgi:hypothetical protein
MDFEEAGRDCVDFIHLAQDNPVVGYSVDSNEPSFL